MMKKVKKRVSKKFIKTNVYDEPIKKKEYRIITDFSKVNEKYCIEADKYNAKVYSTSLSNINEALRIIESNGLSANLHVPPPPTPTNHQKYMLWEKRSVSKPVILQSYAVLYLQKNGYVLGRDYEAHQALTFANELISNENGVILDDVFLTKHKNNFKNVFTNSDRNILRRRSIYNCKRSVENINNEPITSNTPNTSNTLSINHIPYDWNTYNQHQSYDPLLSPSHSYPPSTSQDKPLYPLINEIHYPSAPPFNPPPIETSNNPNECSISSAPFGEISPVKPCKILPSKLCKKKSHEDEKFILEPGVDERKEIFKNKELIKRINEGEEYNDL